MTISASPRVRRVLCRVAMAAGVGAAVFAAADRAEASLTTASSPTGLGLTIPDDGYNGSLPSMASHSLFLPAPAGETITDVNVTIALTHAWIGDLTIKLRAPDGTVITLLNRPGLPGQPDDGTGVGGDSSDWLPAFPITFDDQAFSGVLAEALGATITGSKAVGDPSLPNNPPDYISFADGVTLIDGITPATLTALNGHGAAGNWTLFLGDSAAQVAGSLDSWSLEVTTRDISTPIPEPTSATLMALSGLLLLRRTRRVRV